jgi:hypothetical protein
MLENRLIAKNHVLNCIGPVPENTYPYHATGVDSVRLSLPLSA